MNMDNTQELNKKIAGLETKLDFLESELSYLNSVLVQCGFSHGIQTLKLTVEEILRESPHLLQMEEDSEEIS